MRFGTQVNAVNILVHHDRAEALCLLAHIGHELWAVDAFRKSGEVFNFTGEHQLAARGVATDHNRGETGTCGINCRGESSWARAEDQQPCLRRSGGSSLGGDGRIGCWRGRAEVNC